MMNRDQEILLTAGELHSLLRSYATSQLYKAGVKCVSAHSIHKLESHTSEYKKAIADQQILNCVNSMSDANTFVETLIFNKSN